MSLGAKGYPSVGRERLNRIYIRHEDIARSLYKRRKELQFMTEDVMRLHWDRQGPRALEWARTTIKRMRAEEQIEVYKPVKADDAPSGDQRRCWYRITEKALKKWNLYDANASSSLTTATWKKSSIGGATSESSNPPE